MRGAGDCGEEARLTRGAFRLLLGALLAAAFAYAPPVAAQSSGADSTTQIPPAGALAPVPSLAPPDDGQPRDIYGGDPIVSYEKHQNSLDDMPPNVGSLEQFMDEDGGHSEVLGLNVTEDSRHLKSGQSVDGLLITKVANGSPAAQAGLKAYFHPVKRGLEAAAIIGAVAIMPPAMMLVPVLEASHVGESYDLIIGIDGVRVTTMLAMQDCLSNVTPGEVVYLSLIRDGKRMQVPVTIPGMARASR